MSHPTAYKTFTKRSIEDARELVARLERQGYCVWAFDKDAVPLIAEILDMRERRPSPAKEQTP